MILLPDQIEFIILHHSLTEDSGTVSWRAIRHYHTKTLGWSDVGYHFGLERVRDEIEVFVGRPLNKVGAHCRDAGMNYKSLGICFVGNFDIVDVPKEMWDRGVHLVSGLCSSFSIPIKNVKGHRDYASKSCPGHWFDLEQFRRDLYALS